MASFSKEIVNHISVAEHEAGQRLDNYLIKILKGVPKNHIQRIIRAGEVRVNKRRAKPDYRVAAGDCVRIPPIRVAAKAAVSGSLKTVPAREFEIIFEDDALLVINKPSGIAVHGGSGVSFGVIEQLRQSRPEAKYLELVHRLDKDTSGLLMIAKKRSALVKLHEMLRNDHPKKVYLALGVGAWQPENRHVRLPLVKYTGAAGEKMVRVGDEGQSAHTIFRVLDTFSGCMTHSVGISALSLVEASGCPIAGDERYGDYQANRRLQKLGLKRMFLHAHRLVLAHPITGETMDWVAELPEELGAFLARLEAGE